MEKDETSVHDAVPVASQSRISWNQILSAIFLPFLFVSVLWLIEVWFQTGHERLIRWGLMPRSLEGLLGVLRSPLLHAGTDHLLSNTLPLLLVGAGVFHFYRTIALKVITMIWIFTGCWAWLIARQEYHIGASGLVYGGVIFLFFSGIFRKDVRLTAISLLVVFLYGSLAWGILPIDPGQSWETHLTGSLAGLFAAVYYREEGPKRRLYQWEIDEQSVNAEKENPTEENDDPTSGDVISIQYHYKSGSTEQPDKH